MTAKQTLSCTQTSLYCIEFSCPCSVRQRSSLGNNIHSSRVSSSSTKEERGEKRRTCTPTSGIQICREDNEEVPSSWRLHRSREWYCRKRCSSEQSWGRQTRPPSLVLHSSSHHQHPPPPLSLPSLPPPPLPHSLTPVPHTASAAEAQSSWLPYLLLLLLPHYRLLPLWFENQKTRFRLHSTRLKVDCLSLSLSQKHNNLTEIVLERAPESRIRVSRVWCSHANHCTLHKFGCAVFVSLTLNKTQGRFTLSLSLTKSWISVSRVWCSPEPLHFAQVGWCSLCELQRLYYYSAIYFYMHTFWHHPILQGVLDSSVVGTLLPVLYSCFGFFLSFLSCSKKLLKAPVVESVFWKDFEIYCNR